VYEAKINCLPIVAQANRMCTTSCGVNSTDIASAPLLLVNAMAPRTCRCTWCAVVMHSRMLDQTSLMCKLLVANSAGELGFLLVVETVEGVQDPFVSARNP
jgi:hypothetical protein